MRGMEMSEVVEVGDSGLSCFTNSIFCLLLLWLRIASIEKQPRLLFSPIFGKHLSSTGLKSGFESFYSSPSLPVRGERDSNKWSERTSGAGPCPRHFRVTRRIHVDRNRWERVNNDLQKSIPWQSPHSTQHFDTKLFGAFQKRCIICFCIQ